MSVDELAIFHPPGHFSLPGNPFGKDIANAGLFLALARHGGYRRINVLNQLGLPAKQLAQDLFPDGNRSITVASGPLLSTDLPARGGVLLRGQPYLSELAWIRRAAAADSSYSLVGLIHTIAPPAIREQIGAASIAPVAEWDALICTSPAVQQAMQRMFEQWGEHLRERLGARHCPAPQLPFIPLAVDVDSIARNAARPEARRSLRQRSGIGEQDPLVLWVGRMSFFEKAFPQAMFQAVQAAARATGQRLSFGLCGWFPGGAADENRYREAARVHAPDVNVIFWDGNEPSLLADCWAAADIFLSLADNIQETFGLAPVEAMAAGLPAVVSDWDGYRVTVRDGVDGFLVPTLGASAGPLGELLSHLHTLGLESYQTYVGAVAQHTAVHVPSAAMALERLIRYPEQRAAMGAAARMRARLEFSWPVIVDQFQQLFLELAERRRSAAEDFETSGFCQRLHPLRGDPFADFRGFPSQLLTPETSLVCRGASSSLEALAPAELDRVFPGLRGSHEETLEIIALLQRNPGLTVAAVLDAFPPSRRDLLGKTISWLAKQGMIDWSPQAGERTMKDSRGCLGPEN